VTAFAELSPWQVLLDSEIDRFRLGFTGPNDLRWNWWQRWGFDNGAFGSYFAHFVSSPLPGPLRNSWSVGRRIITGGVVDPTEGLRWGATEADWKAGEPAREALREALQQETTAAVTSAGGGTGGRYYRQDKAKMEVAVGRYDCAIYDELTDDEKRCGALLVSFSSACPGWLAARSLSHDRRLRPN
jgi:hypothetical protein